MSKPEVEVEVVLNAQTQRVKQGGGSSPIGRGQNSNLLSPTSLRINSAQHRRFTQGRHRGSYSTFAGQLTPSSLRILAFPTMAGGAGKYRHLGRDSAHRQALLRNLVTSLFENESITTTWAKAKEAQRLADQLITLGKKNTEASRRRALQIFYVRDSQITCNNYHDEKPSIRHD